jgi:hypothetical protein
MEARDRRRPRRRRLTAALLLAVVALGVIVVASPAVAKHGHVADSPGAALSTAGTIAVIVVAACAALALVLLACLFARREHPAQAELGHLRAVPRGTGHRAAA